MEKKVTWVKSLSLIVAVLMAMTAAGYFILSGEQDTAQSGTVAAASLTPVELPREAKATEPSPVMGPEIAKVENEFVSKTKDTPGNAKSNSGGTPAAANNSVQAPAVILNAMSPADGKGVPAVAQISSAPVDYRAESKPAVTITEIPADQPAVTETPPVKPEEPQLTAVPVSYNWGVSANYVFRMEVKVSNNGSETARDVMVSVPLLENNSPYQATGLRSVNFDVIGSSGRVSTFNLGDIAPGEVKTITADFDVTARSFSLNSSNETLDRARKIFDQVAGSGNCRDLALAFISKCREQGITAREVIGFARTQRGSMTSGSLQGCRHSWAEINVEGLGWVPVDLTFKHFGAFPHTSHIVESYGDQSIKVTYTGGSLSAGWSNAIL